MNYGFVIQNHTCIGCHACSTACKSENEVPLGVHRTWVKTTETGQYPDVRRDFQVTRCNHCSNPPCVRICPVTAMYQRNDGIVEFAADSCIGCKACMQACPYDAIHIDPSSGTAAKCHFCAHRIEVGLEPACVVVCPTHSIISGDLDDPTSEIRQVMARYPTTVRKPEQGTAPKLFYVNGHDVSLHPTALPRDPPGLSTSDVVPLHGTRAPAYTDQPQYPVSIGASGRIEVDTGAGLRPSGPQGDPSRGPIQPGEGRLAGQMVQVGWNAQHRVPWHWPVPAYLVTKSVGSGVMLLLSIGVLMGLPVDGVPLVGGGLLALLMLVATTGLLVADLERPERFLRIVLRPQWRSWLTRGAFLLIAFSTLAGLWWTVEAAAALSFLPNAPVVAVRPVLAALCIPLSIGAAIYTAFLFAQAEGRDLWQSPLLPFHLLIQGVLMGAGGLLLVNAFAPLAEALLAPLTFGFLGALLLNLACVLGELYVPHQSEQAAKAAHAITRGRYARQLWLGAGLLGHALPLLLLWVGGTWSVGLAAILAGVGLYLYEHAFVMAPQELPNS